MEGVDSGPRVRSVGGSSHVIGEAADGVATAIYATIYVVMADDDRLTLRQAREQGRLREFIAQAERDHADAAPASADKFDSVLGAAVKRAGADDRTSRSPARDGSSGKRTRRGTSGASRR